MEEITIGDLRTLTIDERLELEVFDEITGTWVRANTSRYMKIMRPSPGWSSVANPYAAINAVTIYQSWTDKFYTLCLAPKGYDRKNFQADVAAMALELQLDFTSEYILCSTEFELLTMMVDLIQNSDILSGWNSEFFDIPYIMKRLERVAPKLVAKMSFIGARAPKAGTVQRFGSEEVTYKLFGRCHLDYLDLFKKFAQDVKYPTYALGFVGEAEVNVGKIGFDGHFEDFYNGTHRPSVVGKNWDDLKDEKRLDRLNGERELLRQEIENRKLEVPERQRI